MIRTVFVNKGSDEALVKSLGVVQEKEPDESLEKALDKSKLVYKDVQVRGKNGKMYTRRQLVNPDESKSNKKVSKQQPEEGTEKKRSSSKAKPKENRDFVVDKKKGRLNPGMPYMYFPLKDTTKALTLKGLNEALLIEYNKNKDKYNCTYAEFRNGPKAEKFVKDNYFISDGESQTQDFYRKQGEYPPERKKLHEQIIKSIVDSANKPPKGQKPVAILMGGGSAAGKGTIRRSIVLPMSESQGVQLGIVDSDDIKGEIPEYKHFKDQSIDTAAYRVHEESSYIADRAVEALAKEGKNLMMDGTMKNYNKYIHMIDMLHKAGYEVQIVGVDLPLEEAMKRSDERARRTGRTVPPSIIEGSHGGFSETLPKLIDKVDSSVLYNTLGESPKLIMQNGKVLDQDTYNTFLQKGEKHKVDRKLRNLSHQYDVEVDVLRKYTSQGTTVDELQEFLETMGAGEVIANSKEI